MSKREKGPISRRDFGRKTALAASAACLPALLPGAALAQQTVLTTASQNEVDTTVAAILRKYGNRMSDPQKLDVRRVVTANQKLLDAMRSFALSNADQPANVLKIYPDANVPTAPAASGHEPAHQTPQKK